MYLFAILCNTTNDVMTQLLVLHDIFSLLVVGEVFIFQNIDGLHFPTWICSHDTNIFRPFIHVCTASPILTLDEVSYISSCKPKCKIIYKYILACLNHQILNIYT